MEIKINSLQDIKDVYWYVRGLGNSKATSMEDIREYMSVRREFIERSLDFLVRNDYCIIIEGENGVLGFNQDGKEILREFGITYDWKENLLKICLRNLGISSGK